MSSLLHEKPAIPRESTLPRLPGSGQSCENLLRSCGDSHSSERASYLTISAWHVSTARGRITGQPEPDSLPRPRGRQIPISRLLAKRLNAVPSFAARGGEV